MTSEPRGGDGTNPKAPERAPLPTIGTGFADICGMTTNLLFLLSFRALVFHCHDGDTCALGVPAEKPALRFSVRLFGVDAPEMAFWKKNFKTQPFAREARDALNARIKGRVVTVTQRDLDMYNRPVVEMQLQQGGKTGLINLWLVDQGLAQTSAFRNPLPERWMEGERAARRARKGIWSQAIYISPAEWRSGRHRVRTILNKLAHFFRVSL